MEIPVAAWPDLLVAPALPTASNLPCLSAVSFTVIGIIVLPDDRSY